MTCRSPLRLMILLPLAVVGPAIGDAGRPRCCRAQEVGHSRKIPAPLQAAFAVPDRSGVESPRYRSPLIDDHGNRITDASQWPRRRKAIFDDWQALLGQWPKLIDRPAAQIVHTLRRGSLTQQQLRLGIALGREQVNGFLLIPEGKGPFPAVLVLYYDAQTGAGFGTPGRDFGLQLAKMGFVTLSIGKPNTGVNLSDPQHIPGKHAPYYGPPGHPVHVQPLSALAYAAANAQTWLAGRPQVDSQRIGVVGHSFGGKWAMFASCLDERFACAVWSDPGIVFDERDRRKQNPGGSVNYWDRWYLGFPLGEKAPVEAKYRFRKLPSEGAPRTGTYRKLIETGRDLHELHALMAPRPVLVSGGTADLPERWQPLRHLVEVNSLLGYQNRVGLSSRATHAPTAASNRQIVQFFRWWLTPGEKPHP